VVVSLPPPPLRGSHSRAVAVALAITPLLAFAGLELGGVTAVAHAQSEAQDLRDHGRFDQAVAVYRALGAHGTGFLLIDRGAVDSAAQDAGTTVVQWAVALDRQGHADQALALLENAPSLPGVLLPQPQAARTHAGIALRSAEAEAGAGHWDVALHRLDQLRQGNPPADLAAAGDRLRPEYDLQAARMLLAEGRAGEAVPALDDVVRLAPRSAQAEQAQALLPRALLAAGQQSLDGHDQARALAVLDRLVSDFGGTAEARRARVLLRSPQSVTGTVVRGSSPVPRLQLRLGSHFRQVGGAYQTSAPYFYAVTDSRGDFTIDDVPVGGPYVVELLEQGSWTTTVGPDGPAYQFTVQPLTPVDLAFVVLPG
jgi:tetratricopeptide (TPR) repeat protein